MDIKIIEQYQDQPPIEWWYHSGEDLRFYVDGVDGIESHSAYPKIILNTMFAESVIDDYCEEQNLVFFQVPEEKVLTIHRRRPATFYGLKSGLYMCSARDYFNYVSPILEGAEKWLIEYFEQNG